MKNHNARKIETFLAMAVIGFFTLSSTDASAFGTFRSKIPNGVTLSCGACHVDPAGDGARNAFGQDFSGLRNDWPTLAALDSDGDGQSNGLEVGDPCGVWEPNSAVSRLNDLSYPGDANSMTIAESAVCEGASCEIAPGDFASCELGFLCMRLTPSDEAICTALYGFCFADQGFPTCDTVGGAKGLNDSQDPLQPLFTSCNESQPVGLFCPQGSACVTDACVDIPAGGDCGEDYLHCAAGLICTVGDVCEDPNAAFDAGTTTAPDAGTTTTADAGTTTAPDAGTTTTADAGTTTTADAGTTTATDAGTTTATDAGTTTTAADAGTTTAADAGTPTATDAGSTSVFDGGELNEDDAGPSTDPLEPDEERESCSCAKASEQKPWTGLFAFLVIGLIGGSKRRKQHV